METIGFGTGAAGDSAIGIGATDSVEDMDSDVDTTLDDLELESEVELYDESDDIPVKVLASVPVEVPTLPYL